MYFQNRVDTIQSVCGIKEILGIQGYLSLSSFCFSHWEHSLLWDIEVSYDSWYSLVHLLFDWLFGAVL